MNMRSQYVIAVGTMRVNFLHTTRQNIQYDQTLMVLVLFCENTCPGLKEYTCEIVGLVCSYKFSHREIASGRMLSKLMPVL